jgi:hypothetical protein
MENKFKAKWESLENLETQPRAMRTTVVLEFEEFKNKILSQQSEDVDALLESIYAGDAYILKNAFSPEYFSDLISRTFEYGKQSESSYYPMLEGCPDFHKIIDEEAAKKYNYSATRDSFFFFPWNNDPMDFFEKVNERWRVFKFLGGYPQDAYEKNTPIDGIVDRIQIARYPAGGGGLDNHVDPTKNQRVIIGAMMSKRGVDYETGGFYCVDHKMEKVDLETQLDVGDMVCAYPTLVHGVSPVDVHKPLDWSSIEGRWFLGLYSNDSNHIKKRTTVARLTNLEDYITNGVLS